MLSPKEMQAQLAAKREREKKLAGINLRKWIYASARAELDKTEAPDPDEGLALLEANGLAPDSLFRDDGSGLIDVAMKRIALIRIREQEGDALKKQANHSERYRDFLIRKDKEIKELAEKHSKERAALNSEDVEITTVINKAQAARVELFSLPLDEADAREESAVLKELDEVNADILRLRQFTQDQSTLPTLPSWQALLAKQSRLTNKREYLKAVRCELPDFDLELELLDEADSPKKS